LLHKVLITLSPTPLMEIEMEKVWPYILPLPVETEKLEEVLRTVFGSKAALEILKRISLDGKTYQKNLMEELPFSNKTVIKNLKKLTAVNVLDQGMDKVKVGGKAYWAKWYDPTPLGRWIVSLLMSPRKLSSSDVELILRELFRFHSENAVQLCLDCGIKPEILEAVLRDAYIRKSFEESEAVKKACQVLVFGTAAIDIIAPIKRDPELDGAVYVSDPMELPGGSGANVAVALSRLGVEVGFAGKLVNDTKAKRLLDEFKEEGVDVSDVIVEPHRSTLQTFITISGMGGRRMYVLGGEDSALSLEKPDEVNWNRIEECTLVYVGEVFLEIAELLASYAKSHGKTVVYSPGMLYLDLGVEKLSGVLKNVDIFMMNKNGWKNLKANSKGLKDAFSLLNFGIKAVTITKGGNGSEVIAKTGRWEVPAFKVEVRDTTGAGDAFSAGFIKAFLGGRGLEECLRYAHAVGSMAVTGLGARSSYPKSREVQEFLDQLNLDRQ
jgi:sugar/nucleoside kinase (ribokinase family)/predicted transcriptional regulator